jgi:hypothetical protein
VSQHQAEVRDRGQRAFDRRIPLSNPLSLVSKCSVSLCEKAGLSFALACRPADAREESLSCLFTPGSSWGSCTRLTRRRLRRYGLADRFVYPPAPAHASILSAESRTESATAAHRHLSSLCVSVCTHSVVPSGNVSFGLCNVPHNEWSPDTVGYMGTQ